MSSSCAMTPTRGCAPLNEICLAFHRLTSFSLPSCTVKIGEPRSAMILVGVPFLTRRAHARAGLKFACQSPFVNYCCERVDIVDPRPRLQQNAERSADVIHGTRMLALWFQRLASGKRLAFSAVATSRLC